MGADIANSSRGKAAPEIGTFADDGFGLAVDGIDDDLDRLLGELLGHFGGAALKQLGRARRRRIEILGRDYRLVKPLERINHPSKLVQTRGQRVNARFPPLLPTKQNRRPRGPAE